MSTREAIVKALTGKTTGLTSTELIEATGITKDNAISGNLFYMVKTGAVMKHKGESANKSRYSLNPEQLADRPARKSTAKKTKKAAKKKKTTRRTAPPQHRQKPAPAAIERNFIPAITVDQELVLVDRGDSPAVRMFSPEDTLSIAQLMLSNFSQA